MTSLTVAARLALFLAATLLPVSLASAARAADPVFPIGSRVGLVPPSGMTVSKSFSGFEDQNRDAAILITAVPAAAYDDVLKTVAEDALKKQGITVDKRETLQAPLGKGVLILGTQQSEKAQYRKWLVVVAAKDLTALINVQVPMTDKTYSDAVVRAALATVTERADVPETEELALLPFTVSDLAGLHVGQVLPGRALMLVDAPKFPALTVTKGLPEYSLDARLIIAAMPGGPQNPDDRANFARFIFDTIVGIKDVQITESEPLRIGTQPGFETVAQAKDATSDKNVMVVQWLRFANNGFLQMIGISQANLWLAELSKLRAVRDSVDLR